MIASKEAWNMSNIKVLIVEDDRALSEVLLYNLKQEGFNAYQAFDGRSGIEQARLKKPDIVLLDIMLPGANGVEVCRQLRKMKETKDAGIVMLTAKTDDLDQIGGFEAGADDYVTKPYSIKVLLERIRALQRRRMAEEETEKIELLTGCGVKLDLVRHRAFLNETELELTRSEFSILKTLMIQPGKAYDRTELIEEALGEDTLVLERTIDVHIRALRKKFGDNSDLIETVRGVGYRFKETE